MNGTRDGALGKAMTGLATFRIVKGAASWIAPRAIARFYGSSDKQR